MATPTNKASKEIAACGTRIEDMRSRYNKIAKLSQQNYGDGLDHLREFCKRAYDKLDGLYNKSFISLPRAKREEIIKEVRNAWFAWDSFVEKNIEQSNRSFAPGSAAYYYILSPEFKFMEAVRNTLNAMCEAYENADRIQTKIERNVPLPQLPPPKKPVVMSKEGRATTKPPLPAPNKSAHDTPKKKGPQA